MPLKVEQINEYLFSEILQSQKTKRGSDEISQGQYRGYPSIPVVPKVPQKRRSENWEIQQVNSGPNGSNMVNL